MLGANKKKWNLNINVFNLCFIKYNINDNNNNDNLSTIINSDYILNQSVLIARLFLPCGSNEWSCVNDLDELSERMLWKLVSFCHSYSAYKF
jgi:hypothetical protein